MDSLHGLMLRAVVDQVEPYLNNKSTTEKANYLEKVLFAGENFSANIHKEENARKKVLGSLQMKVVILILHRLVELLENTGSPRKAGSVKAIVEPSSENIEDVGILTEKLYSFKRRLFALEESLPVKTVSLEPLAEEMAVNTVVRSPEGNPPHGKRRYDRSNLSFLQLPEPHEVQLHSSAPKMDEEATHRALLRKRRGDKSSTNREWAYPAKERNEVITSELLSLTKQLKSGSEEIYEALKRDQERLGKLADAVDSNLLRTGKQLKLTEQFGVESRKTKWHVWIILSLLPLVWLFVYLTIRFY
ncbi:hypothetical protein GAYE_SCF02G2092 [Galdieria yellowstonensis]|uniref:Vesicle transport protein USE1 n=1 Tax=Galdieria yellowstonensis TaxID=3028027 RepID=A0AAV9IA06_9RHOD|nr:hypothetical protein GAYE_SCF02G2092 [Galdieria yellowstonensis]